MHTKHYLKALLILLFVAGCAGSRKAAQAPHPLAGNWDYTLDTPQGVYTGILTFTKSEVGLTGVLNMSETPVDDVIQMEELVFDDETQQVTYAFNGGEYGRMVVTLTLDGDNLDGSMNVLQFGLDVPLVATRKTE